MDFILLKTGLSLLPWSLFLHVMFQMLSYISNELYSIIAVHGLAANPAYTWVKKIPNDDSDNNGSTKVGRLNEEGLREILWLKHLLPAVLPNARILKYNYDSTYLKDAPKESLRSIASRLIHLIHDLRKQDLSARKRPIIFIGHSFGGVVIADVKFSSSFL